MFAVSSPKSKLNQRGQAGAAPLPDDLPPIDLFGTPVSTPKGDRADKLPASLHFEGLSRDRSRASSFSGPPAGQPPAPLVYDEPAEDLSMTVSVPVVTAQDVAHASLLSMSSGSGVVEKRLRSRLYGSLPTRGKASQRDLELAEREQLAAAAAVRRRLRPTPNSSLRSSGLLPTVASPSTPLPRRPSPTAVHKAPASVPKPVQRRPASAKRVHFHSSQRASQTISLSVSELCAKNPKDFVEWVLENNLTFDFIYLVQRSDRMRGFVSIFDIQIVPYEQVTWQNYVTFSPSGVAHFRQDRDELDYMPLAQWLDLKGKFDIAMSKRFFYSFRKIKYFFLWRDFVIAGRQRATYLQLGRRLLLTKPLLCQGALALRYLCTHDADQISLARQQCVQTYNLDDFVRLQTEDIQAAFDTLLTKLSSDMLNETLTTCQRVCHENGGLGPRDEITPDVEVQLRNIQKLQSFIRYADFFLASALCAIVFKSNDHLVRLIAGELLPDKPRRPIAAGSDGTLVNRNMTKAPLLHLAVRIDKQGGDLGASMTPSRAEFLDSFRAILDDFVATAAKTPRLLNDPRLRTYIYNFATANQRVEFGFGQAVDAILTESQQHRESISECLDTVCAVLDVVDADIDALAPVLEFMQATARHDFARFEYDPDVPLVPIDDFRSSILYFRDNQAQITDIRREIRIGCFHVDKNHVVDSALPVARDALDRMHAIIPRVLARLLDQVTREVQDRQTRVNQVPDTLEQCVAWFEYVAHLRAKAEGQDDLRDRFQYLLAFHEFMKEMAIRVPSEDATQVSVAVELMRTLDESVERTAFVKADLGITFGKHLSAFKETLVGRLNAIFSAVNAEKFGTVSTEPTLVRLELDQFRTQLAKLEQELEVYLHYEMVLQQPPTTFTQVDKIRKLIDLLDDLWNAYASIASVADDWLKGDFHNLRTDKIKEHLRWVEYLLHQADAVLIHRDLLEHIRKWMREWQDILPVVNELRSEAMSKDSWNAIRDMVGGNFSVDEGLTLEVLLSHEILKFQTQVTAISKVAATEHFLEKTLTRIAKTWETMELNIIPYGPPGRDIYILGPMEELKATLEDDAVALSTMMATKHNETLDKSIADLFERITTISQTLDAWYKYQQLWMYLEKIFGSPDIQRQLPRQFKHFVESDKDWKSILQNAFYFPKVQTVIQPGFLGILGKHIRNLEKIKRTLQDHLNTKRSLFARFYFLSNDELLAIMADARNPRSVEPFLPKCFDSVKVLDFAEQPPDGGLYALGMQSPEGERVPFIKRLRVRGGVESWLSAVEVRMRETLQQRLKTSMRDHLQFAWEEWVFRHPAQVVVGATQIMWCRSVTEALAGSGAQRSLPQIRASLQSRLGTLAKLMRSALTILHRTLAQVMIVIEIHHRDVVDDLIAAACLSTDDFEWTRHLRFFWEDDACTARQLDATLEYSYEYLGCSPRLVVTPLTERCYLTATQALSMFRGCAPEGPAGTGKTETVKDLAKALARNCLVFNCSENLDYKMMGQLFSGLVQTGSWACFDEFNRIDLEVLSVIAQQLLSIQTAIAAGAADFIFDGLFTKLNPLCGFFITMNPGYSGRNELPANLKALFRPVAMMAPDETRIAEILLLSSGFAHARPISRKVVYVYRACREQLSDQIHYDFGLRSMKMLLGMASSLRAEKPSLAEEHAVLLALQHTNVPRLAPDDQKPFAAIVGDVFDTAKQDADAFSALSDRLRRGLYAHCAANDLQTVDDQMEKIGNLFEILKVRHGVMLVGRPGSGKSTCLRALAGALHHIHTATSAAATLSRTARLATATLGDTADLDDDAAAAAAAKGASGAIAEDATISTAEAGPSAPIGVSALHLHTINPRSVSLRELYGVYDEASQVWADGLLGSVFRRLAAGAEVTGPAGWDPLAWHAVVLDGPVDPVWVENLNSVLDDSKMLCLPNGERIKMSPAMRIVFETDTLANATPATVSRCGMVFVDSESSGLGLAVPLVRSWATRAIKPMWGEAIAEQITTKFFAVYLGPLLEQLRAAIPTTSIPVEPAGVAADATILFEHLVVGGGLEIRRNELSADDIQEVLAAVFVYSMTWAVAGRYATAPRGHLDLVIRKVFHSLLPLPEADTVFDYHLDPQRLRFVPWAALVPPFHGPSTGTPFVRDILVPSPDVHRLVTLAQAVAARGKSVLVAGPAGTGKTLGLHDAVRLLLKGSGGLLGPDREQMPYGSRPPIEFSPKAHATSALHLRSTAHQLRVVLARLGLRGGGGGGGGGGEQSASATLKRSQVVDAKAKTADTDAGDNDDDDAGASNKDLPALIPVPQAQRAGLIVIDDLSAPVSDAFGTRAGLEVVRQWLDAGGYHDPKTLRWHAHGALVVAASARTEPGSGRIPINGRVLRHFFVLPVHSPSPSDTKTIVQSLLETYLPGARSIAGAIDQLAATTSQIYADVVDELRPTAQCAHYVFSLRQVADIVQGILQVSSSTSIAAAASEAGSLASNLGATTASPAAAAAPSAGAAGTGSGSAAALSSTGSLGPVVPRNAGSVSVTELWEVWHHEVHRVFRDRLSESNHRDAFDKMLADAGKSNSILRSLQSSANRDCVFADFMPEAVLRDGERLYTPASGREALMPALEAARQHYDDGGRLVLFPEAVDHVLHICRAIRQPAGHMLIAGISGCGKRTMARFAAHVARFALFEIALTSGYGVNDLHDDLRKLFERAGVKRQKTMWLLSDVQIATRPGFPEAVHALLIGQEPSGVYSREDRDLLLAKLRAEKKQRDGGDQQEPSDPSQREALNEKMLKAFWADVKANLRIVVCADASGSGASFHTLLRQVPLLLNVPAMEWVSPWSEDAILQAAERLLRDLDPHMITGGATSSTEDERKAQVAVLCRLCVAVHQQVLAAKGRVQAETGRQIVCTPSHFLELLGGYRRLVDHRRTEYAFRRDKLRSGVARLSEAGAMVADMQKRLEELQPVLENKAHETHELVMEMDRERRAMAQVRATVQEEEAGVLRSKEVTERLANEAQDELRSVMPALEAATRALQSLNIRDIVEIKTFQHPPEAVVTVFEAVCVLLQTPVSWSNARQMLQEPDAFLQRLLQFNRNSIPAKVIADLKKYIANPLFQPEKVARVSVAAKSICEWVHSIRHYAEVYADVDPKMREVARLEKEAAVLIHKLDDRRQHLARIEAELEALETRHRESELERQQTEKQISHTQVRLDRAVQLVNGLERESRKWTASLEELARLQKSLAADSLLVAGALTYFGAFSLDARTDLAREWGRSIRAAAEGASEGVAAVLALSAGIEGRIERQLAEAYQVRSWNLAGLPGDRLSVQNAALCMRGDRWPLLLDPEGQAARWIKTMESSAQLRVAHPSDSDCAKTLRSALQYGFPVLLLDSIEDPRTGNLGAVLEPFLFARHGTETVLLDGEPVRVHQDFRMYLTTKLGNPLLAADVWIRTLVINFAVPTATVEEQLLEAVLGKMHPELEEQRSDLVLRRHNASVALREIEDRILQMLGSSQGQFLDDDQLIDALQSSQNTYEELEEKLVAAEATEADIEASMQRYLPVAQRGRLLFYFLQDLGHLDHTYQYSLAALKHVLSRTVVAVAKEQRAKGSAPSAAALVEAMVPQVTWDVFCLAGRGMLERHRVPAALHLALELTRTEHPISENEYTFLVRGAGALERTQMPSVEVTLEDWVTPDVWTKVSWLDRNVEAWHGFKDSFLEAQDGWREAARQYGNPEIGALGVPASAPVGWQGPLGRLLLVRALCPSLLVGAVRDFVHRTIGHRFLQLPPLSLEAAYADSTRSTPLFFVITPGQDPMTQLSRFAEARGMRKLSICSLGQGQGPVAGRMVREAMADGTWVFLQNCHLAPSWMSALERIVDQLAADMTIKPGFRLWLSSRSSRVVPLGLVRACVKMVSEAPRCIRDNVKAALLPAAGADAAEPSGPVARVNSSRDVMAFKARYQVELGKLRRRRFALALTLFHAKVSERRRYGSSGWNLEYEFSASDLETASTLLQRWIPETAKTVSAESLQSAVEVVSRVTCDIVYGGRVTDRWDKRVMETMMRHTFVAGLLDVRVPIPSPVALCTAGAPSVQHEAMYPMPRPERLNEEQALAEATAEWPDVDPPEMFGLHASAQSMVVQHESRECFGALLALRRSTLVEGSKESREASLAAVQDLAEIIVAKLPERIVVDLADPALMADGPLSMGPVLRMEIAAFNALLAKMSETMEGLERVWSSSAAATPELDEAFDAIFGQRVPAAWLALCYPTNRALGPWLEDLCKRVEYLRKWVESGQPPCVWLRCLFHPKRFVAATIQHYARRRRISVDDVRLEARVVGAPQNIRKPASDGGVFVSGLAIEGAVWDADAGLLGGGSSTDGEGVCEMPALLLQPRGGGEAGRKQGGDDTEQGDDEKGEAYRCPVYRLSHRGDRAGTRAAASSLLSNLLMEIDLPCAKGKRDEMVMRGVALFVDGLSS